MHDDVPEQAGAAAGSYRIERLIGVGGMAAVYEARPLGPGGPGERVACKVMHEERRAGAAPAAERARVRARRRELARREAVLGLRVTAGHPGLVRVLDYFDDARGPGARRCIVMELVDGVSVDELRGPERRLPFPVTRRIAREVLQALAYLHGLDVLHRDLSPRNILVSAGGSVKVADLGIAKVMEQGQAATRTFRGVTAYASPEALQGESIDARSELFTLAAVLFDLVAGTPPCGALEQESTIILHMVQGRYVPLPPDTPSDLAELITVLQRTARDERRPRSAAEALALLRGEDQPMASPDELAALVAAARARRGRATCTDMRPPDVLAPGHVLAPEQGIEGSGLDAPAQASGDMIRLRRRDRRAAFLRAAGLVAAAAGVLVLGSLARDHLPGAHDAAAPVQPAAPVPGPAPVQPAAPVPGPAPVLARPVEPMAPVPVVPAPPECPATTEESPESNRAAVRAELRRERTAGQREARHSRRNRVRGEPVPLGSEPPPWARP